MGTSNAMAGRESGGSARTAGNGSRLAASGMGGERSALEQMTFAVLGGALVAGGLRRRSLGGSALALAGGALLYQAISGSPDLLRSLGLRSGEAGARREPGAPADAPELQRSITVDASAEELYRLWREPETLPRIMAHVAEVRVLSPERARWVVRGPLGQSLAWETQMVEDRPGELLRWESPPDSELPSEGWVRFRPAPGDRGTEATLYLRLDPPAGALGDAAVKLLGTVPRGLLGKALHRFKSLVETGEIPTTERQPAARNGGRDD